MFLSDVLFTIRRNTNISGLKVHQTEMKYFYDVFHHLTTELNATQTCHCFEFHFKSDSIIPSSDLVRNDQEQEL